MNLDAEQLRRVRARNQRLSGLAGQSRASASQVVAAVCGIQAQDASAAALGIRARSVGLRAADVERALHESRTIVRVWAMRGTLHLLAAEDLDWILGLLGPIFTAAGRRRRAELGLDDATSEAGTRALVDTLAAQGPLTRAELAAALGRRGFPVRGQAIVHLLGYATLTGAVIQGPLRNGEAAWALRRDWVARGRPLAASTAAAELARRYLRAYAPATPDDFAAWSGLPLADVRGAWSAISAELTEVRAAGEQAWALEQPAIRVPHSSKPATRLLPAYDSLFLGYRSRDILVPPGHARRVHPGGGVLRAALLVDGVARATWRTARRRGQLQVLVEPFGELPAELQPALAAEVADIGRFLATPATLIVAPPKA